MVHLPLAVDVGTDGFFAPEKARFVAVAARVIDRVDDVEQPAVDRV